MEHLADFLTAVVQRFGDAPALVVRTDSGYRTWSYAQVGSESARLAALLAGRGIGKGDRVVIWASNHPAWVVAFFGCLRAGAVVVPLDVQSAPDFVERVVDSTAPKLAFVSRQTPGAAVFERLQTPCLSLDDLDSLLAGAPASAPGPSLRGGDLAEIVFTSGTTGNPKGVMLTHWNIVANVLACNAALPSRPEYCMVSLLPLSHMLEQTSGLLAPLLGGARMVYPLSRQPAVIFKAMQDNAVVAMVAVPQVLHLLMSAIEREVRRQHRERQWAWLHRIAAWLPLPARRLLFRSVLHQFGGRLQFFICGGAYLAPGLWRQWEHMGVLVLQGYGTTETSPVIAGNTLRVHRMDTLGKVLPGQDVKIAPDGEILTRGANVTSGYWNNPEATASAFEDGWYKTGDLGSLDRDGWLHFRGRKKDLIVLASGMKVYPEDIENQLRQQPGVTDAVVLGLPRGDRVDVHAVLLLEPGADGAAAVRAVNRQLAAHQQVRDSSVWPDADFPRSHTLKVRKHLVLERLRAGDKPESRAAAS